MLFDLVYSPKSQKSLLKLPKPYQRLILSKLPILEKNPKPRGFDKIASRKPPLYRIRIGYYRIFYFIDEQAKKVIIVDILRRTTQTYR